MEREEDVAYVRALGVDYAQGFYFGEPMTEREAMNLINALAKSSKRDEKREKKKEKAEAAKMVSEPPEAPPIERTASRPTLPPDAPASAQGTTYQLPVPVAQRPVKSHRKAGLITALRRGIGGMSSMAGKALSVFKPRKKAPAAAKPKPMPQRPGSVATPRDARSLHGRLGQVDPAQAEAAPRPPAPAGAMRPSAAPRQPPPVPPQQPPRPHPMQPAHMADPAPDEDPVPDFLRSDGTQGRRRRG
jgi:hypothetical protein